MSAKAGCEFCYVSLVVSVQSIARPEPIRLIEANDAGKFVLEMTCLNTPNVNSRCQVLVATSVLEEGLDVAQCDLVIIFSGHTSLIRFIQSRGRARKAGSRFILIVDKENKMSLEDLLKQEKTMYTLIDAHSGNGRREYMLQHLLEAVDRDEEIIEAIQNRKDNKDYKPSDGDLTLTVVLEDVSSIANKELERKLIDSVENMGLYEVTRLLEMEGNAQEVCGTSQLFTCHSVVYKLPIAE